MTDLLRIFRAITPGDVAGIGCIVFLTLAILVGTP
jgi:hypothetical protein